MAREHREKPESLCKPHSSVVAAVCHAKNHGNVDLRQELRQCRQPSSIDRLFAVGAALAAFRAPADIVQFVIPQLLLVLWASKKLWYRILHVVLANMKPCATGMAGDLGWACETYARHQFEDGILGILKEAGDLLEGVNHRHILSDSFGHARC